MALMYTQPASQAELVEHPVNIAWIILTQTSYIMHAYTQDFSTRRRQTGVDEV
jgi:hypothetical protein